MNPDVGQLGGIVTGIVQDLEDPDGMGRVRVRFPWLEDVVSGWARVASLGAGNDRGAFFRPEVGDEVLVGFELGDFRRPFVLGGLWNRQDPHPDDGGDAKSNNWRVLRSRSGHIVRFDDTKDAERIEIVDKDQKRRFTIDCGEKTVEISSDQGDVTVRATDGKVTIEASADVVVRSKQSNVDVSADSGSVTVKGATDVSVQATNIKIKASANCDVQAGGVLTLKGSVVKIN